MKAFLCHNSNDQAFVDQVDKWLRRFGLGTFNYTREQCASKEWPVQMREEARQCPAMVIFVGGKLSDPQKQEITTAWNESEVRVNAGKSRKQFVFVAVAAKADFKSVPHGTADPKFLPRIDYDSGSSSEQVARKIAFYFHVPTVVNGLPSNPRLFNYEKMILRHLENVEKHKGDLYLDHQKQDAKTSLLLEELRRLSLAGAPLEWPQVREIKEFMNGAPVPNPWVGVEGSTGFDFGVVRTENHRVRMSATVDGSDGSHDAGKYTLPEAGPRGKLWFPPKNAKGFKVGVLVSGGIAPGINAVIDGIVQRHWLYHTRNENGACPVIYGYQNGFSSLLGPGRANQPYRLLAACKKHKDEYTSQGVHGRSNSIITSEYANEGGSIIGTSRVDELTSPDSVEFLEDMARTLLNDEIDVLYVIGGDGSMRAAHALWTVALERMEKQEGKQRKQKILSIVGVPKTMDNDILWVWQSFGFMSAVEKAREVIESLYTEVSANPRLGVVQLFGSVSGFVVSHAVLASSTGHCELALIPEVPFSIEGVAEHMRKKMAANANAKGHDMPFGLIVMAETAIPTDVDKYLDLPDKPASKDEPDPHAVYRVELTDEEEKALKGYQKNKNIISGQTSDSLRRAGLKLMSTGLANLLKSTPDTNGLQWQNLRCLTNEPRHLLRSAAPSCSDIINCQRLGTLAVDNAMGGYTDFMISQWLTEFVLVPLSLVVLGRKQIYTPGIFWKSVIAKTGQHESDINQVS